MEFMDQLTELLIGYGYWGMFLSAFLAGSVLPFSSEVVMSGLLLAHLNPWQLLLYGTIGNVLGSLLNYYLGRQGKIEWLVKYCHVKPQSIDRAMIWLQGRGAWMGIFAFLPIIGSAIAVALGLMRSNVFTTTAAFTVGKIFRYFLLIGGTEMLLG